MIWNMLGNRMAARCIAYTSMWYSFSNKIELGKLKNIEIFVILVDKEWEIHRYLAMNNVLFH